MPLVRGGGGGEYRLDWIYYIEHKRELVASRRVAGAATVAAADAAAIDVAATHHVVIDEVELGVVLPQHEVHVVAEGDEAGLTREGFR